jgi:hypothetical protein
MAISRAAVSYLLELKILILMIFYFDKGHTYTYMYIDVHTINQKLPIFLRPLRSEASCPGVGALPRQFYALALPATGLFA